ncbi:MAG: gliding motility-associated protein GldM [Spirosomataceae bacterium]|jgi:gliding motility-associated protein GldM
MAGVKESPRQKMINMMYLVLTAMLALQISNAILQKFELLNNSLEQANSSANDSNAKTILAMREAVDKAGNKPEYVKLFEDAEGVRKQTSDLITHVEGLKSEIRNAGGGIDPETGMIKNAAEEEKVAILMVGDSKSGKGYDLKTKLEQYVADLQKYMPKGTEFGTLTYGGENPQLQNAGPSITNKDFAELNFSQTPVPAALATLSQKQSEIRRLEGEVLDYLAQQVGAKEIKFDKIFAVVIPNARSIVAGQTYKADIAIGAYSTAIRPSISVNGQALSVTNGKATYEVRAQGGQYDKSGKMVRSYTASVSFPKPDGTRETVTQEEKYTILKPSVQISSATMPPLYLACANNLQLTSPGLGELFKPTFGGSGADFIPGGSGKVTVVPNSRSVSMNVLNEGVTLETFPFTVRKVPKPDIKVFANNQEVSDNVEKRGLGASSVRVIKASAISDADFKATNPEDATYRITGISVSLARGTRRVDFVEGGASVNIGKLAQQAEAGDRYLIEVKGVQRKNFRGAIEDIEVGFFSKTLPLN